MMDKLEQIKEYFEKISLEIHSIDVGTGRTAEICDEYIYEILKIIEELKNDR